MASALVVTDLDGTLLDTGARLGDTNRRVLEQLGENGCLRVVATGRSLHSAQWARSSTCRQEWGCLMKFRCTV